MNRGADSRRRLLRFWIASIISRNLISSSLRSRCPWRPPPLAPPPAAGRGLWTAASMRQRAVPPRWRLGAGSAAPWSASRPRSPTRSSAASPRVASSSPPSSSKPTAPLLKLVLALPSQDARRPDREFIAFCHFSPRLAARGPSSLPTPPPPLRCSSSHGDRYRVARQRGQGFPCEREAVGTV